MFVIETDADARLMANLHATDQNELLFTTYTFTHNRKYSKEAVHMARHLWQNLREIGRLQNTILISYDLHSCQVLTEHGIPCFLDRWSRQPDDLPGTIYLCAQQQDGLHIIPVSQRLTSIKCANRAIWHGRATLVRQVCVGAAFHRVGLRHCFHRDRYVLLCGPIAALQKLQ